MDFPRKMSRISDSAPARVMFVYGLPLFPFDFLRLSLLTFELVSKVPFGLIPLNSVTDSHIRVYRQKQWLFLPIFIHDHVFGGFCSLRRGIFLLVPHRLGHLDHRCCPFPHIMPCARVIIHGSWLVGYLRLVVHACYLISIYTRAFAERGMIYAAQFCAFFFQKARIVWNPETIRTATT